MPITLLIKDVMDKKVVSIEHDATVAQAIKKMVESHVWSLVVEKQGLPVGVVTERDTLKRCIAKDLLPGKMTVDKIMSSPLISVRPDATIREAMGTMAEKDIRRLFVVEKGKIVGRITQTMLFDSSLDVMMTLSSLSGQL